MEVMNGRSSALFVRVCMQRAEFVDIRSLGFRLNFPHKSLPLTSSFKFRHFSWLEGTAASTRQSCGILERRGDFRRYRKRGRIGWGRTGGAIIWLFTFLSLFLLLFHIDEVVICPIIHPLNAQLRFHWLASPPRTYDTTTATRWYPLSLLYFPTVHSSCSCWFNPMIKRIKGRLLFSLLPFPIKRYSS